ncbi:MAG: hypothetical protein AVDCRST_MAG67-2693, partial [uncultured Solirubrobacteraceae bacterium]
GARARHGRPRAAPLAPGRARGRAAPGRDLGAVSADRARDGGRHRALRARAGGGQGRALSRGRRGARRGRRRAQPARALLGLSLAQHPARAAAGDRDPPRSRLRGRRQLARPAGARDRPRRGGRPGLVAAQAVRDGAGPRSRRRTL